MDESAMGPSQRSPWAPMIEEAVDAMTFPVQHDPEVLDGADAMVGEGVHP